MACWWEHCAVTLWAAIIFDANWTIWRLWLSVSELRPSELPPAKSPGCLFPSSLGSDSGGASGGASDPCSASPFGVRPTPAPSWVVRRSPDLSLFLRAQDVIVHQWGHWWCGGWPGPNAGRHPWGPCWVCAVRTTRVTRCDWGRTCPTISFQAMLRVLSYCAPYSGAAGRHRIVSH